MSHALDSPEEALTTPRGLYPPPKDASPAPKSPTNGTDHPPRGTTSADRGHLPTRSPAPSKAELGLRTLQHRLELAQQASTQAEKMIQVQTERLWDACEGAEKKAREYEVLWEVVRKRFEWMKLFEGGGGRGTAGEEKVRQ